MESAKWQPFCLGLNVLTALVINDIACLLKFKYFNLFKVQNSIDSCMLLIFLSISQQSFHWLKIEHHTYMELFWYGACHFQNFSGTNIFAVTLHFVEISASHAKLEAF